MRRVSRRSLLKQTAAAGIGLAASRVFTARSYAQVAGSNSDIRLAVVGCNDCGRSHIRQFRALSGVRLVALCDADQAVIDRGIQVANSATGPNPQGALDQYLDARRLLERNDIDAISTATPNHWHSLITIWACQAGKDVYVEKPVCHNVWEGQQMVAASRRYNRIVQAGTQWRSMPTVYEAMQWVKSGKLGAIKVSRGFCYKRRASLGSTQGPQPVPSTVDYNLWCGPSPLAPLRRTNLHYDWHWFWETGNGDVGNQGAHNMDLARWALDKSTVAPTVMTIGGRFGYIDDGQTPNTMMTVHDYGDAQIIFEVRGLPHSGDDAKTMDKFKGVDVGNVIECEGGYVTLTTQACAAFDKDDKQIQTFTGEGVQRDSSHPENFLKAVRSRRREDQQGEIVEGFVSSCLSHLSNISYRMGHQADPDEITATIKGKPAVAETFARFNEHLAANGVHLDLWQAQLGLPLEVNVETQSIKENHYASAMLTRTYRDPFVVPKAV